jgi:hypothetical protein
MNILKLLKSLDQTLTITQVIELLEKNTRASKSTTFIKNSKNETVAIYDYYFKKWVPIVGKDAQEITKKNTPSGFNSMTKLGTNLWTKRNNNNKYLKIQGLPLDTQIAECPFTVKFDKQEQMMEYLKKSKLI